MYEKSIASCRESLPTQAASVKTEERARREAVIGLYPNVVVPGGLRRGVSFEATLFPGSAGFSVRPGKEMPSSLAQ
jgi:hypothetical protein